MRKFTLLFALVTFSSFLFAQVAQKADCELTKGTTPVVEPVQKSALDTKDAGDIFWEEDFGGTEWQGLGVGEMPEGYSVYDANEENFYWEWSNTGPYGRYTSPNPGVIRDELEPWLNGRDIIDDLGGTGSNGFIMINGDMFNTGEDGQLIANYLAMDSYFQIDSIDLSTAPGVTLKYNQMYRWCCSGGNQLSVFVASDYDPANPTAAHWIELDSRGLLGDVNEHTFPDDRQLAFDISDVAAGQPKVTIRFHEIGASHYYWMVDDIQLVEPNSNDLVFVRAWWDYALPPLTGEGVDTDIDWTGGYTHMPEHQTQDFVSFRGAVKNFGLETQEEAALNVTITKDGSEVYNETGPSMALDPAQQDTLFLGTSFTPDGMGHYMVSSTAVSENVDEDPTNNTFGYEFYITDYVYSRTYDEPFNNRVFTGGWVSGGADGDGLAAMYEIFEPTIAQSMTTYIWDNDGDDQLPLLENGEFSLIGRIYQVDEEAGEVSTTPKVSTDLSTLEVSDTMAWLTLDFIQDGESEVLMPGTYYACFEFFNGGDPEIDFEIAADPAILQPRENFLGLFSGEWYWLSGTPVINIDVSSGVVPDTYELTFNVDMSEATDFDPAVDSVIVAGNFSDPEWQEPGTNAALILSDDDEDMVYSLTVEVEAGEYMYKYFMNSGWAGGEWDGDPNREVTVVDTDVATDDDWGIKPGVAALDISKVSIYPNPTNDILNIANMVGVERIVVSNIIGQEVLNISEVDRNISISTADLDNGVYIVTFIDANKNMQSTRIIKK